MYPTDRLWMFATLMAAAGSFLTSSALAAEAYPARAVTIVVPGPAGGPSDIAARALAKGLSEDFKQPFVIENRPGAAGNIGTAVVAKAPADGYMLLVTSAASAAINPSLYKDMTYDPQRDLAPITKLLQVPLILAVNPAVPARNLDEFIAWARAQPGGMQFASSGGGSAQHLTAELFGVNARVAMAHIPYKGSAPAIVDVIAGHVPVMFDSAITFLPQIKAGKLRPIAITSLRRSAVLPEVPTFDESGMKGFESYAWFGLFAPASTPRDIVNRINAAARKVMREPEWQRILADAGSDDVGDSPEDFAAFTRAEAAKWAQVVKASGAKID